MFAAKRYPNLIADEIEANETSHLESHEVLRRSRTVFDQMLGSGEDSRGELWEILSRDVQHGDAEFINFSSNYVLAAVNGPSRPDSAAVAGFLVAFGKRLQSPPAELALNERGEYFVQFATTT